MAKTRENEKKKLPKVYKKVYPFLLFIATLFMGIGYAKVADINLDINGQALALEQEGIIITSANVLEVGQTGVGSVVNFSDTLLNTNITLANNADSTVTFEVSIGNNSSDGLTHYFSGVTPNGYDADFYPNRYITYELDGLEVGDALAYKDEVTFTITFKYINGVNFNASNFSNTLLSYLSFNFDGVSMDQAGGYEYVIPRDGYYSLEVWGASGYSYSEDYHGGYGGYSMGKIYLEKGTTLYIHTGGQGIGGNQVGTYQGGYNGGGNAVLDTNSKYTGSGGGATHIALVDGELSTLANNVNDILIVAGGGGAVYYEANYLFLGGHGGGIEGTGGIQIKDNGTLNGPANVLSGGGTQNAGGTAGRQGAAGAFGQGGELDALSIGAGGGFYGGGNAWAASAGGGSGYIGNGELFDKHMIVYKEPIVYNEIPGDGETMAPFVEAVTSNDIETATNAVTSYSTSAIPDVAKSGDGFAKIIYLDEENDVPVVTDEYVSIFGTEFKVIDAIPTLTNSSNNTEDESGVYASVDTNTGNPTYYFRGNVTNNYVDFAGYTWRVVRVNEDGTIRVVMNTGINNNTQYTFNPNNNAYNYMYYTNSNVIQTLSTWYNDNISAANKEKVVTGDYFCEQAKVKLEAGFTSENADMSVYDAYSYNYSDEGVDSNHKPSFTCIDDGNGYGIVNASIGLLTYDEVLFAGGYNASANDIYYLNNGENKLTWLMSPAGVSGGIAQEWRIDGNGAFAAGRVSYTTDRVLRPVLNLKADVMATGTGEANNHWVIQ